ncbi:hypothetical protein INT48_002834 [Thamnidium elegans]|uniref:C2H2-type domain-containing protein n=1 Tax=Thamnidium elegans TaxID=101142 RepID=A0A8H7SHQ0_9FUNG|nr:hypothetical protein INT48_002834 [Thamnidium elegans]
MRLDATQTEIKQEEDLNKDILYGNVRDRPECAQAIDDVSCQICTAVFNTKEALLEHQTRLQYHCKQCNKCFKKEVRYWTHMVRVHPSESESDTDSLCCEDCKFKFPSAVSFDRHMAVIHQTGAVPLDQLKIVQDEIPPTANEFNYCTQCQFTFVRKNDFFTHLVRVHAINMELEPYPIQVHHPELVPDLNHPHYFCNACEYTFRNQDSFWQHVLKQHGILHQHPPDTYRSGRNKTFYDRISSKSYLKKAAPVENPEVVLANSKRCETCQITLARTSYKKHLRSIRHGYILASLKVQSGKVSRQKSKVASKQNQKKLKDTIAQLLQELEHRQKPLNGIVSNLLEQLQEHKEEVNEGGTEQNGYDELQNEDSVELHQPYVSIENAQLDINDNPCLICNRWSKPNDYKLSECRHRFEFPDRYGNKTPDINDPNHYCAACVRKFTRRETFIAHLIKQHGVPHRILVSKVNYDGVPDINNSDNTCTACERVYASERLFKLHLARVHSEHFQNAKVSRAATVSTVLNSSDASENRCGFCDRQYHSKRIFRAHVMDVHGLHVPEAEQPETEDNLPKPKAVVSRKRKTYTCDSCQTTFRVGRRYQFHMARVHGVKPQGEKLYLHDWINLNETPDLNGPVNTCTACKRKYASDHTFRRHLIQIHNMTLPEEAPKRSKLPIHQRSSVEPDVGDPRNWCASCDRVYSSKYSYRKHLRVRHLMNLPKYSIKTDPERENLRGHSPSKVKKVTAVAARTSPRVLKHSCGECDTTYFSKRELLIHMRFSHKIENVASRKRVSIDYNEDVPDANDTSNWCKACDKMFQSRGKYQNHLGRVHHMYLTVKEYAGQDELPSFAAEKSRRDSKKQKSVEPRKRAIQKKKTDAKDTAEMRILRCNECNDIFYDNLLYQIHLTEGHEKKLVLMKKKKKRVQWDLPQDADN